MREEEIGAAVIDSALRIHRDIGPGLLESVNEALLVHELRKRGLELERQVAISLDYEGLRFEEAFRADVLVERKVIIEIKCVEKLDYAHKKQLLTYLRLADMRLGYLLNFAEALMKNGITRTVHRLPVRPT